MAGGRGGRVGARRILVYGVTGSGKSTTTRRLAELTGIPMTDVDSICWDPNWTPVDDAEQRRRFEAICAADTWLLDTAYGQWLDVPLARAQLIIGLDFPRWLTFGRLVRRTARRVWTREKVCNGNVETLGRALARDSILWWHVTSFSRKRARLRAWAADPTGPTVLLFRRPKDLASYLASLT